MVLLGKKGKSIPTSLLRECTSFSHCNSLSCKDAFSDWIFSLSSCSSLKSSLNTSSLIQKNKIKLSALVQRCILVDNDNYAL